MSRERRRDQLAWEQSVNELYLRKAENSAGLAGLVLDKVAGPANVGFAGDGPKKPKPEPPARPLVGRVALTTDDEDLGCSFYVGDRFTRLDDNTTTVVNWAAEAARLFFEGREAHLRSPEGIGPQAVAARRAFKSQGHRIVDFEDDFEPGVDPSSAFRAPSPLAIPPPPVPPDSAGLRQPGDPKSDRRWPTGDSAPDRDHAERGDGLPAGGSRGGGGRPPKSSAGTPSNEPFDTPATGGAPAEAPVPLPPTQAANETGDRELRAERLLREAIEAPKTGDLAPVLSTLQFEQHRLVTWPYGQDLVVQGHPGTGKTIVAAHRAAYLVLPKDREDETPRLHKVALVGPTERWREHIQPTAARLADEGVEVLSLKSLVRDWAGGLPQTLHPTRERELHSRWAIGRIVDRAASAQRNRLSQYKRPAAIRELVNSLVQDTEVHRRFARHESLDLSAWLLEVGSYKQARSDPSYLLFLAAAGIAAGGTGEHSGYQHIVVDEAQDIRPVEWWMLSQMFRAGAEERWSLLGDMNQRRSDSTWESWETLTDHLGLPDSDGSSRQPEVLDNGYRSTREILDYAAALLPRGMRKHRALRSGPEPSILRVGPQQLTGRAVEAAERLAIRYHQGSVAVIAWDRGKVQQIERTLLKQGWHKDSGGGRWLQQRHRVCRLSAIRPVEARGLEFDAVVVVEPADFEPNLGRHGELYTGLTRANQELVVIHSKAMPRELAGRGNRVGSGSAGL